MTRVEFDTPTGYSVAREAAGNMPIAGRVALMQMCDSLDAGGLERMAVNLANSLPQERYELHLCTTRRDGPLAPLIGPHVHRLRLNRKSRFDRRAFWELVSYIRVKNIRVIHAHGTSLFLAIAVSCVYPYPKIVWHVHFGKLAAKEKTSFLYLLPVRRLRGVIAVSEPLAEWVTKRLFVPSRKVWYIPNFVAANTESGAAGLPGQPGSRIVCVANLRPQKDHTNLLRAMRAVLEEIPAAHLILLGDAKDPVYRDRILGEMTKDGLEGHVTWLGPRSDVSAILKGCDIGVLGSNSEGLPLALIEYGMAGLAAVSTRVGQCEEVLDNGKAGLLVERSEPQLLGKAMLSLLKSSKLRTDLGQRLLARVREMYSKEAIIQKFCDVYDQVLEGEFEVKAKR